MGNKNSTLLNVFIFRPPPILEDNIEYLKTQKNVKIFLVNNISMLEVYPEVESFTNNYKAVIYSHGICNDIFTEYIYVKYLANLLHTKVIVYDYPYFGLSDYNSELNEQNCVIALETVVNYYKKNKIMLIGHSFGTSIVISFIHKNKWEQPIILLTPFKSFYYVLFGKYVSSMLSYEYDSYGKLKTGEITCKIQFVHPEDDCVLPVFHSKEMHEMCLRKNIFVFEPIYPSSGGHSEFRYVIDDVYKKIFYEL